MPSREIDVSMIYDFQRNYVIRQCEDQYLVINPLDSNWLVLSSEELLIFEYLKSNSIEQAINKFEEDDVISVVTQIEAKEFYITHSIHFFDDKSLFVYLTNKCNLKCNHCYMFSGEYSIEEIDIATWKTTLQDFVNIGGQYVTFSGGEVTIYKGFQDIIKFAKEIGLMVTVLSNGILWSEELVSQLHSYIDEIQLSMDGYDKESYKKVRNYDGFSKVINTIELFRKYNNINISVSITPLYDDLDEFCANFYSFAVDFMNKYPNVFLKFNYELIDGRNVESDEKLNSQYRKQVKQLVDKIYPGFSSQVFANSYVNFERINSCGYGGITIAANGDVYFCNRITELKPFGNIKNLSIKEIYHKSHEVLFEHSVDKVIPCKDCEIKYLCGGGCRLKYEYKSDGTIINSNCDLKNKQSYYKKMISANEYFYLE